MVHIPNGFRHALQFTVVAETERVREREREKGNHLTVLDKYAIEEQLH